MLQLPHALNHGRISNLVEMPELFQFLMEVFEFAHKLHMLGRHRVEMHVAQSAVQLAFESQGRF